MKTAHDPRHIHRIELVKKLFTFSFAGQTDPDTAPIEEKLEEIDQKIQSVATEWSLSEMNKIDLAILRLGVFELMKRDLKPNIIIDEAIEIAKEYGADSSPKFVNAVLSKIASQYEQIATA